MLAYPSVFIWALLSGAGGARRPQLYVLIERSRPDAAVLKIFGDALNPRGRQRMYPWVSPAMTGHASTV